jgi:FAD dependent oxidoreductase TIGR03364
MTHATNHHWDDAVVGAGILGLAHAYHLAKRGRRVIVFERSQRALGASVRNFGMLWPIGQPAGAMHRLAMRSREIWLGVLAASGIWHDPCGSLHLAYRPDEAEVLKQFVTASGSNGFTCELLNPDQVLKKSPAVKQQGLLAGMWSPTEVCVDPRAVIAQLPGWLAREYGVDFQFGTFVTGYIRPMILTDGTERDAERFWLCSGDDFQTLYPELLESSGMIRCKLQMMRSQPFGDTWRLGPMLAGGLTLRHYKAFDACPALAALRKRVVEESPQYDKFGIHVMASQNGHGEIILGDSHEYGDQIEPFDKGEIEDLILDYLQTFLDVPGLRIAARWHGTYAKHPSQPYVVIHPSKDETIVTGVGGAGMTLSFGLAEQVVDSVLGKSA